MGEVALIVFPSTSLMLQHLGLHEHDTNVYCAQPSKLRPLRNALAKQVMLSFKPINKYKTGNRLARRFRSVLEYSAAGTLR